MIDLHDKEPLVDLVRTLELYARGETDPTHAQECLAAFMPFFPLRIASNELGLKDNETHIDDFIDDAYPPKSMNIRYARWVLFQFRLSAHLQYTFEPFISEFKLYATYKDDRVRVVGASCMGDVWITRNFDSEQYTDRVGVDDLTEFCDSPTYYHMGPEESVKEQKYPNVFNRIETPNTYVTSDTNIIRRSLVDHHYSCTPVLLNSVSAKTGKCSQKGFVDFFGRASLADSYFVMRSALTKKIIAYGYQSPELEITLNYSEPDEAFLSVNVNNVELRTLFYDF